MFRFKDQDILQHAEQCNGSGDCRKSHLSGGTMCPSYIAAKSEKDTTRARANILRETLTQSDNLNRFDSKEIKEVLDLCLVCKACKSECPSNVDIRQLQNGVFASISKNEWSSRKILVNRKLSQVKPIGINNALGVQSCI